MCTNEKLTVRDHMTHVIKIDSFTGHEEIGYLHFDLKIIFLLHIYRKSMHVLKACTVKYECITYCLSKLC